MTDFRLPSEDGGLLLSLFAPYWVNFRSAVHQTWIVSINLEVCVSSFLFRLAVPSVVLVVFSPIFLYFLVLGFRSFELYIANQTIHTAPLHRQNAFNKKEATEIKPLQAPAL